MRRYQLDRQRIHSQWKLHWDQHVLTGVFDCPCDRQQGRFRKRRAFGHRRRCYICRGAKYLKQPTRQQLASDQAFREELDEIRSYQAG